MRPMLTVSAGRVICLIRRHQLKAWSSKVVSVFGSVIFFVIVSLIGNVLNLALNLLGCYVHDMRLQFLEFFGRFYEDGGKAYEPLGQHNTKYVEIIKEEQ